DDHGKFVYENYIPGLPFVDSPDFIEALKKIIVSYHIDAIYPAMDTVVTALASQEKQLGCKVICSPSDTTQISNSKSKTYECLRESIVVPNVYSKIEEIETYPVFMKPDVGYGSRGAKLIKNRQEGLDHIRSFPSAIILENLPGKEYTIDCF